MNAQPSLLDAPELRQPTPAAISDQDLIEEAQLHALGLDDYVARFSANKRWPAHEVERKRQRAEVAWAIVRRLRDVAGQRAAS